MATVADGDGCRSRIVASTTANEGKGSDGSMVTVLVVTIGRWIREVEIVVVFINEVEDVGLCTSIGSRVGAQEVGVGGDESGGWGNTSTGGMRLASSVARLTVLTRNGVDGNLEAVPCALAMSLDGVSFIWIRDAKEPLDWLVDVFHLEPPIELNPSPAN